MTSLSRSRRRSRMSMFAVTRVPRTLAEALGRHGASAVANARTAAESLGTAVAERTELTRLLLLADTSAAFAADGGALELLSPEECVDLLGTRRVGRLAYIARLGVPDIVPVNYILSGGDVLIRSGPGPKLQAAERRELVAFEVDDVDEAGRTGWSVVVHGSAARLTVSEQQELMVDAEPWAAGPRHHVIRVRPRRITGRRLG